jgi:predicted nucleic acid-binding protein
VAPFYLDANVLIAIVEGKTPTADQMAFLQALDGGELDARTSELSLAECLVKPYAERNEQAIAAYLELLSGRTLIATVPITRAVLLPAARLRAETRLKMPDAIHLATALETDCATFLSDDRGIKSMKGLKVQSWSTYRQVLRP